ncbi:agmatinase [Formosimonas limnophila]|uniref:Agmatinase n=1 Tax=Formosimonas limnophila TaxID=1384487 RepID=A0A8J3FZK1_9BURK|nr:agmatinase [Formosimonas limnophila]GHA74930.1 agmatinase [Formosimonas limnophila]
MPYAYQSSQTFLAIPHGVTDKPFAVVGIPYDGAVTNRPGARFGPSAIRQASQMLCDGTHPYFDVSPFDEVTDYGDLMMPNTSIEGMRVSLAAQIPDIIAKHHVCWLGGDHSITLGLLRAYRAHYQKPLAVLHFDAHCDTWDTHFDEPSGHGTWVYEAIQEGLVDAESFIQIGIRSAGVREARDYVKEQGGVIYTARDMRGLETLGELSEVLSVIRARLTAKGLPVYLTVDIDHLDPAFAPGTGTPEPAGMTTNQTFTILEQTHDLPWVSMDCVEVAPAYDHAELTSNAAAQIVWTYLSGQVAKLAK